MSLLEACLAQITVINEGKGKLHLHADKDKDVTSDQNYYVASCMRTSFLVWDFANFKRLSFVRQRVQNRQFHNKAVNKIIFGNKRVTKTNLCN